MAKFRTVYDRFMVHTEAGSPIRVNYLGKLDKVGRVELIEKGIDDQYMFIQSFADSVDLNVLIARFNNGDDSALNGRVGQYLDVTDMPTTYAEAFEMVQRSTDVFNALPLEIREKYENNLGKFISDIGSDHFNDLFGKKADVVEPQLEVMEKIPAETLHESVTRE